MRIVMKFRYLLAALALTTATTDSMAGPWRRRAQPVYQPVQQATYQSPTYLPAGGTPADGYVSYYAPAVTTDQPITATESASLMASDGLDEVNAKRAARGLRPYLRDEGLTQAARACAAHRAAYGLFGHTSNDFAFIPAGSSASSTGCAAYPASYGWMSCCTYDNYTYAGAAWATGRDGQRYMHLYVR
jgi:hypothetical protein